MKSYQQNIAFVSSSEERINKFKLFIASPKTKIYTFNFQSALTNELKTEVYDLAEYIANKEIFGIEHKDKFMALYKSIKAAATDGLGISETDLDQILPDWKERHSNTREGYKEVDEILMSYLENIKSGKISEDSNPVIERHRASYFKRINPENISRYDLSLKNIED